jgi:hypothetical protein
MLTVQVRTKATDVAGMVCVEREGPGSQEAQRPDSFLPVELDVDRDAPPVKEWDPRVAGSDPCRVTVQVVSATGRGGQVSFHLRHRLVGVWYGNRLRGVLDRALLRTWLRDPFGSLVQDDVSLSWDRTVDRDGRIAITMPGLREWVLSPVEAANLTDRV